MRDLFKTLAELGAKADELTRGTLNCGGCCVYAALVAEQLEAMGVPVEVVVCRSERSMTAAFNGPIKHDVSETKKLLRQNNQSLTDLNNWVDTGNVFFEHVVIRFWHDGQAYLADSNCVTYELPGEVFYGRYKVIGGSLTVEEATMLANAYGWSSMFLRGMIPELAELVNQMFGHGLSSLHDDYHVRQPGEAFYKQKTAAQREIAEQFAWTDDVDYHTAWLDRLEGVRPDPVVAAYKITYNQLINKIDPKSCKIRYATGPPCPC